ncbi:MAG: ATP-binding protein [Bacteroidota bacterium]
MQDNPDKLRKIIGDMPIRRVYLPNDKDLNEIYLENGAEGLESLIASGELTEVELEERVSLAIEGAEAVQGERFTVNGGYAESELTEQINNVNSEQSDSTPDSSSHVSHFTSHLLEEIHEGKLRMKGQFNNYYVLGMLPQDLSSLQITIMVEERATTRKERSKLDLYERAYIQNFAEQIAQYYYQDAETIENELLQLTDLLEKYRELQISQTRPNYREKRAMPMQTPQQQEASINFLKEPNLLERIDALIEQAGVVGEENTRKLIFVISSTYKMGYPLHALVQGSSGSGKSHLINTIGQCFPPEDVLTMTRVTSKSFYHYTKEELVNKLILIQDFDGLDEEAQYAFRELQSAGTISSSTTYKDRTGNITSTVKTVKSHFASLLATTKAEIYYDNMSRSIIIGVDESEEQTQHIIEHQNHRLAGVTDNKQELKAKIQLQNIIRNIKSYEVINPYADKVKLPLEAKMLRRLNNHYQAFVRQITLLHQYQREKDHLGRLIAQPEDLKIACEILFEAIMLKVDELDSSMRQFYNQMKAFVKEQAPTKFQDYQFTQRDIRLNLNASKSTSFRHFEDLELLEYIQRTGGYANRGFKYKIVYWDDMDKIRSKVKQELNRQLETLLVLGGSSPMEHHDEPQCSDTALSVHQSRSTHLSVNSE